MGSLVNLRVRRSSSSRERQDARTPRRHRRRLWVGVTSATAAIVAAVVVVVVSPTDPLTQTGKRGRASTAPGDAVPVSGTSVGQIGVVADWVNQENAKPGTDRWRLAPHQRQGQVEGYADHVSAQQGDTVALYLSTTDPALHVEAYRMGFYGGLGGRLVWQSAEMAGVHQAPPQLTRQTNMVEARW